MSKIVNKIKRGVLSLLFLPLLGSASLFGSSPSDTLTAVDRVDYELLNLKLPPIELLYESSANTPTVRLFENRLEQERLDLKSERRKWLNYFGVQASYQYGMVGATSYSLVSEFLPYNYQYSVGSQIWYNIGAYIRIPLDHLFDRRTRIKFQKLNIGRIGDEVERSHIERKMEIVKLYYELESLLSTLPLLVENWQQATIQYGAMEGEYLSGQITMQTLATSKSMETQATLQLEQNKAQIRRMIALLELLSNYKIIK
ncbi:MAG: TolC family protein [Bacteroidales bacterium]